MPSIYRAVMYATNIMSVHSIVSFYLLDHSLRRSHHFNHYYSKLYQQLQAYNQCFISGCLFVQSNSSTNCIENDCLLVNRWHTSRLAECLLLEPSKYNTCGLGVTKLNSCFYASWIAFCNYFLSSPSRGRQSWWRNAVRNCPFSAFVRMYLIAYSIKAISHSDILVRLALSAYV